MKVLLTGASGLLGSKLTPLLASRGWSVVAVYRRHVPPRLPGVKQVRLDITDTLRLEDLILKEEPDVVIHAAAYTDVDGCERNRGYAWRVNVEATRSVMRASRVVNAYLVYVSTDYVFDGEKGMYRETDTPNPVNYYGLTKLIGEEVVRSSDILYCVVRTSAIYGVAPTGKGFAVYLVERLRRGEEVKALVDQYVSPTYNAALAEAIAEIAEARPMGTLHVAGPRMSRFEFARMVARALGAPEELVKPARMEEMRWAARRPRDSSLDTSRARRLLKTKKFYDAEASIHGFIRDCLGGGSL